MNTLYTRQFVSLLGVASLSVCVGIQSPSYAQNSASFQRQSFGLVHLTNDQVAHLYVTNMQETKRPVRDTIDPIQVRLQFLDSDGNTLLQPEAVPVLPGQTVSLDLFGEGLQFPPGSSRVGVRAVVDTFNPYARILTSLELEDNAASARFVFFRVPFFAFTTGWPPPPTLHCLGPLTLKSTETATFTFLNSHATGGTVNTREMTLEFTDGANVLAQKFVTILPEQSASLDLSDFNGLIRGCFRLPEPAWVVTGWWTLEIFDNATGQRVAHLAFGYPSPGGPNGGGGYGY